MFEVFKIDNLFLKNAQYIMNLIKIQKNVTVKIIETIAGNISVQVVTV